MKIIKSIMILIIISTLYLMNAKQTGIKTIPVQTNIPAPQPQIAVQPSKQPIAQQKSYANALNIIRHQMRSDQILQNNRFTQQFINFVKDNVQNSDYPEVFAKALLQAGGYLNVSLTGNQQTDYNLFMNIRDQVDHQINVLFSRNVQPIIQPQEKTKERILAQPYYLVSTDINTLTKFGLCPLFDKKAVALNQEEKELADELRKQGSSEESILEFLGKVPPHYSVFNENHQFEPKKTGPGFDTKYVGFNVPCVVALGKFNNWNRTLLQLKSLDQLELAATSGLSAALCAGHSLNNARLMRNYALTGNTLYLKDLHNINDSVNFLLDNKFGEWLYVKDVKNSIENLGQDLGIDGVDISAISTVSLLDSNLDKQNFFEAVFDKNEFNYVQRVKKDIQTGLKKDNYIHVVIVGNEETVGMDLSGRGHYFCFVIIKKDNQIQYIVLDTLPGVYHLQAGSHERNQLMFIIENIEGGNVSTVVPNVPVKLYQNMMK